MAENGRFVGATVLAINEKRWDVSIVLQLLDGTEETLVASADSWFTDSDHIWFGTKSEHESDSSGAGL